jgi:nicotinamidase-related amidase
MRQMNSKTTTDDRFPPRSPELMCRDDTALLVVDVQQKLIELVPGHWLIVWNIGRLIEAAKMLGLPTAATEQYPQGLGGTVRELAERLEPSHAKVAFSCAACGEIFKQWNNQGISRILVCGIESHVCVQQTVIDLLAAGYRVYVAVDAIGARFAVDHEVALRRMESSGAVLTTTEAAMFEWCQQSDIPEFKRISALVRQRPPGATA